MGSRYYCLDCEAPYSNHNAHFMRCNSGCVNCGEHGPGYPCENIKSAGRFCYNCRKTFYNSTCYTRHLENGVCNQFEKCLKCGVISNTRELNRRGRHGHVCGEYHCRICHQYHAKEKCFIEPYKPRCPRKPYRIITYDFESQQIPIDNSNNGKKIHAVNFICAKIFCTDCIAEGTWTKPLDSPCDICGPYRTRTWAPFKISDVHSDCHKQTDSPLTAFTEWLLNSGGEDDAEFDPRYPSICFAHFVRLFLKKLLLCTVFVLILTVIFF